ncbi:MAG: 2-hydroxychromene-2-carboxylate isomerase [Nannocystaceae bacterium]|nr:2-hydroxychromene-2-carboxylate isomerase [Nannocystaceae bacterium]
MARTLRFSFDFISPYAYLAWARLHDFAARHHLDLELEPVLFAALLNAWGHKGPAEIPPKRIYTFKHVVRLAADQGMPLRPPPAHPFNPLLGLRLAALELPSVQQRTIIDVLYARVWASGEGITDSEAVAKALTNAGLDGPGLVEAASSNPAKARLKAFTAAALERGVFGVPTYEIDGELFWGQDSIHHIERFLRGEDPARPNVVAQWANLPAQARRS